MRIRVTGTGVARGPADVDLGMVLGTVLFLIGVAPLDEARTYLDAFSRVRQSVELTDRR